GCRRVHTRPCLTLRDHEHASNHLALAPASFRFRIPVTRPDRWRGPTTPLPAAKIGEDDTVMLHGVPVSTLSTFIRNLAPGSAAGIPGLSLARRHDQSRAPRRHGHRRAGKKRPPAAGDWARPRNRAAPVASAACLTDRSLARR